MAKIGPNSSNIASGEVGNTKSSPSAQKKEKKTKTKQEAAKSYWLITLKANNIPNSSLNSWFSEHATTAIWQLEKGEKTDYYHYQISVKLKGKKRLTWLSNHFSKIAHCEVINNIDAAFNYTQKSDTRVAGPFHFPKKLQEIEDPLEGCIYYKWQQQIVDIIKLKPDKRKVYWYWEETGNVGKTSFSKHLILKYNVNYVRGGKKADIFHALTDDMTTLILDISRSSGDISHLYDILECVKDGLVFSGKYESKTKIFNPPHLIVFSNIQPDTTKLSADRWVITNLANFNS